MSEKPAGPPTLLARMLSRFSQVGRTANKSDSAVVPTEPDAASRRRIFMRELELLVADGKGEEAAASMRSHFESDPLTTDAMHVRYRRLLEQLGDDVALGEHTQTYVSRLLGEKREREALSTVRSMLQRDAAFRVRDAEQRLRLARTAMNSAMADVALALAADFHLAHPKHAAVPELALLGARLLVDRNADTRAARELLRFAADGFPDHPKQPEIFLKIEQIDALEARLGR